MKLLLQLLLFSLPVSASFQSFEIYVSDAGNFNLPPWQIVKYDQNGDNPVVFIEDSLDWPQDILFLESEEAVLISNLNSGRITKHHSETGEFIDDFATGIGGPTRMEVGPDGLLYVPQWNNTSPVLRYQLDGTFVDEFTSVGIPAGIGLDWDSSGNLYVSSYSGSFIRKFDPTGLDLGIYINTNIQGPTNIHIDESDHMFVLNWNGSTVSHFDQEGDFVSAFIAGLNQPEGIEMMENGDILIGNGGTAAIKRFDSLGNFIEDIVEEGLGNLRQPNAVVIRSLSPDNVLELKGDDQFLISNTGQVFTLSKDVSFTVDSVTIYRNSGEKVIRYKPDNKIIWDASDSAKGLYILQIATELGEIFTQRVVVK